MSRFVTVFIGRFKNLIKENNWTILTSNKFFMNKIHFNFLNSIKLDREAVAQTCSVKEVFLEISQNLQENTSATVSILINLQAWACNFIKIETLARVFSCEFCEISKNTFP